MITAGGVLSPTFFKEWSVWLLKPSRLEIITPLISLAILKAFMCFEYFDLKMQNLQCFTEELGRQKGYRPIPARHNFSERLTVTS